MVARTSGHTIVPTANSAANATTADVIGSKSDGHTGDSLYAKAETMSDHIHSECKVYPTLAPGVTVTAEDAGTTWTFGAYIEVVPASTIGTDFDIHLLCIEDVSDNTVYQLELWIAEATRLATVRVSREGGSDGALRAINIQTQIIPADSQIKARVATPTDDGETIDISLQYHTY